MWQNPILRSRYPLEQVVAATRYVETEQKLGNVVLTLVCTVCLA